MRVLVTGGARSGKSMHAESLVTAWANARKSLASVPESLASVPESLASAVDYVATGYPAAADDADWAARVRAHQQRRPVEWRTIETLDIAAALRVDGEVPVLIDCVGLWLTRTADDMGAWAGDADAAVEARVADLLDAVSSTTRDVVLVTNEVGLGLVPDAASGRWFRDALGRLNIGLAERCDEVWLCVAGIPVPVKHG